MRDEMEILEFELATPLRRLAAYCIDVVVEIALWAGPILIFLIGAVSGSGAVTTSFGLLAVIFFASIIFWRIWCLRNGQTPGKSFLQLYVMREDDTRAGGWYTFLREWIIKSLLFLVVLSTISFGIVPIIAGAWLLWDRDRQTLWDKVVSTSIAFVPSGVRPLTGQEIHRSQRAR